MWYKMKVPKNLIFMLMKPNLLKGNGKKIFCFVYMYSQRMFYNWMYDMYIYNYSLFYLNKN